MLRKVLCLRRKLTNGILETPWDFNARTGRRIFKLFADTGVIPLWRKVLQATFKQTWRETTNPVANTNMLREIRCDRPRSWWVAMMANTSNKRQTGSSKRARKGPVRMWEDTIVEALGIHWRSQMTSCRTYAQWLGITRSAVEVLIHKWKLPKTALPSKDKVRMRVEEKIHTIAQQILLTSDTGPSVPGRIQFIVDCQPLSNIICGKTPITNVEYSPICERIFNNIHSIIGMGGTFHNRSYPIEWRPRNFNQLADKLANDSMDLKCDISWFSDTHGSWREKDVIIFSDGGFREKQAASSAAWVAIERPSTVVGSLGEYGVTTIIGKGATLLNAGCSSSFMAEAIALEAATVAVCARREGQRSTRQGIQVLFETAEVRTLHRG